MLSGNLTAPEFQFLLLCCRRDEFFSEESKITTVVCDDLDEDRLYDLLNRHRILPFVYSLIKNSDRFSGAFKLKLRAAAKQNQLQALAVKNFEETFLLQTTKIRLIGFPLKGVGLSEKYYGDIGIRQVFDVDLYVEPKGFKAIARWLQSMGYKDSLGFFLFNKSQQSYFQKTGHDLLFVNDQPGFPALVELHWRLREQRHDFGAAPTGPLNQTDEFLYLCVHGTEHAWFRLKWLVDIIQILSEASFDWKILRNRATELNCLMHLEITWLVLHALMDFEIPSALKLDPEFHPYAYQLDFILNAIGSESPSHVNRLGKLKQFFYLRKMSSSKLQWDFFLKYLTSHNDWKLLPLPDSLFFLYFPLRPFLWAWRGILSLQIR